MGEGRKIFSTKNYKYFGLDQPEKRDGGILMMSLKKLTDACQGGLMAACEALL
jgi:hypothetical protein